MNATPETNHNTQDSAPGEGGGVGGEWTRICDSAALTPERAVAALAPDGTQLAVVRTHTGEVFAVGHRDPYAMANVIARGVVGTRTDGEQTVDVIQSPLFKQAFDLRTGEDVADRSVSVGAWRVRERDSVVELGEQLTQPQDPEKKTR